VTDEPNPAAVMANREALIRNLEVVFGSPNKAGGPDDIATLQAAMWLRWGMSQVS